MLFPPVTCGAAGFTYRSSLALVHRPILLQLYIRSFFLLGCPVLYLARGKWCKPDVTCSTELCPPGWPTAAVLCSWFSLAHPVRAGGWPQRGPGSRSLGLSVSKQQPQQIPEQAHVRSEKGTARVWVRVPSSACFPAGLRGREWWQQLVQWRETPLCTEEIVHLSLWVSSSEHHQKGFLPT